MCLVTDGLWIGLGTRLFDFFPVLSVLKEPHPLPCKTFLADLLEQSYLELGINSPMTANGQLSRARSRVQYRDRLKGLYVVARSLLLLLLTCSAWPCLGPA